MKVKTWGSLLDLAITAAASVETRPRAADVVQAEELTRLVAFVAQAHAFTAADHAEALEIALSDPIAALDCFRALAAEIKPDPVEADDRITCDQCRNLFGLQCLAASELGATLSYMPITTLRRRCTSFLPLPDSTDQRSAAARWPTLQAELLREENDDADTSKKRLKKPNSYT